MKTPLGVWNCSELKDWEIGYPKLSIICTMIIVYPPFSNSHKIKEKFSLELLWHLLFNLFLGTMPLFSSLFEQFYNHNKIEDIEISHIPHPCKGFPYSISHTSGTFVRTAEPTLTHHSHLKSIPYLGFTLTVAFYRFGLWMKMGPHIKSDKLRGGPQCRPYKLRGQKQLHGGGLNFKIPN